jgi:CMP-N-acetylneuraminic acid synthetase
MKSSELAVSVIPARGVSRDIARKLVRLFPGKPITHQAIEAARDSGAFAE